MSISDSVDVCPNCGSTNVRWRRRRLYDVILTYLRYVLDIFVSVLFGAGRTTIPGSSGSERASAAYLDALQYSKERAMYEARTGTMTASRFWKCPDCRKKGQVFDRVDGLLGERERLVGLEDEIGKNLGAVGSPLGPNDAKRD